VEEVWDEVVEVLAEGIDERRLEMAGAPAEASSARLSSSRRGKEMREREKSAGVNKAREVRSIRANSRSIRGVTILPP
jgi:hypothetical protein